MAEQPHVTILPIPGLGHLIPLLELANRLVTLHGFRATFLLLPNDAQSNFLTSTTFPDTIHFIHLPPLDISPFLNQQTHPVTRVTLLIKHSLPIIESSIVSESLQRKSKTTLIVDLFATEAFQVADNLSIPKYVFFASTAALLSFMVYLPVLDREVEGDFVDLVKVPGCSPILSVDLVDAVKNRKDSYYTSFLYNASMYCTADGILVNTSQDLEPVSLNALRDDPFFKQISTPRVYPVGPIIRTVAYKSSISSSECMTWLDRQPAESVLFVSFGSHGFLSSEQITELAQGLELSGKRFIWVVTKPKDTKEEHSNDPFDYLPDGFGKRIQGLGMVVPSWAPQEEILAHAATGAFLSHCGWNSTLESISNGVPMLTWPLFAEQRMNAKLLVEELGVAVRVVKATVDGEIVRREEVEKVVRAMMEGEEGKRLRGRMKELREKVLEGLEEGGSSYNSLCDVVREWKLI